METSHGAFYSPSQVARLLLLFFPVSLTCLTNQSRTFLALASTLEIKFRINVGDPALEANEAPFKRRVDPRPKNFAPYDRLILNITN